MWSLRSFIVEQLSLLNAINILLRGLSIAGRFALIFFIANNFSASDLGLFGIFNTSVILGVQLVGLDFYVFSGREIVRPNADRQYIAYNQVAFHVICYIITIPLACSLFFSEILPWSYFFLFSAILILEHLSNEAYRLLIVLKLAMKSSILLFIKSALWVLLIPIVWYFNGKSFNAIFYCWIVGLLIALIYGYLMLEKKTGPPKGTFDESWILTGIRVSIPFFISTLLLKVTEYSNRYFIDVFQGKHEVGLFTFYSGFSNILSTVVFTLVVMTQYPALLEAFAHGNEENQKSREGKILKDTFLLSVLLSPLIIVGVWILTQFYQGGAYSKDFISFVLLVLTNMLISLNYATHYMLYARKKDNLMVKSYLVGCVITFGFNFLLVPYLSITGAAISNFLGFLVITLMQLHFAGYGKRRL